MVLRLAALLALSAVPAQRLFLAPHAAPVAPNGLAFQHVDLARPADLSIAEELLVIHAPRAGPDPTGCVLATATGVVVGVALAGFLRTRAEKGATEETNVTSPVGYTCNPQSTKAAKKPKKKKVAGGPRRRAPLPVMQMAPPAVEASVGTLLVTDGTDSFYESQRLIQYCYNTGTFNKVIAFSSSAANSKKMLLTREARYSGLWDSMQISEGGAPELAKLFGEAKVWVCISANEKTILDEVAAASKAGVKRVLIHLAASEAPSLDTGALTEALTASGMEYTLLRTGEFSTGGEGGILCQDLDLPACAEVPKDDVFRFIAEALSLDAATGKAFSLCAANSAELKQIQAMRRQGKPRREEVEAILTGTIQKKEEEEKVVEKIENPYSTPPEGWEFLFPAGKDLLQETAKEDLMERMQMELNVWEGKYKNALKDNEQNLVKENMAMVNAKINTPKRKTSRWYSLMEQMNRGDTDSGKWKETYDSSSDEITSSDDAYWTDSSYSDSDDDFSDTSSSS
jgi:hypothetical protein